MAEDKKKLNSRIYNHTLANQGSGAERKVLIIIDGNAIVHRAYHALPPLTTKSGELVNAIYGFLLFFVKAINEFNPDFVAAVFDFPAPTLRHKEYEFYKANRKKAPDDLYEQIPKVKEILKSFGVEIFEKEGYEGDDLIGTISKVAPKKQIFPELETIIMSGDLDVLQLVDKHTKAYILRRGIKDAVFYDETKVKERYNLTPEELPDFKAIRGDPSDNIPGILGVGEKTATELISQFGSLDNLYQELEENTEKAKKISSPLRKKLLDYKSQAFMFKGLTKINLSVPIEFNLEKCRWKGYNKKEALKILKRYEFKSLIARIFKTEISSEKE